MTTPSDFAGATFDFAMGEVYGIRVWQQDEYGRLRARHVSDAPAWRPGMNVARCLAATNSGMGALLRGTYGSTAVELTFSPDDPANPAEVPSERCKCGFYAYTRETADTFEAGGVVGVIRGSGRTLIGTRGFRCEKAEIVALLDPTKSAQMRPWPDLQAWSREKLRRLYPDVPLLDSRQALLDFAPIDWSEPDPSHPDFWTLP